MENSLKIGDVVQLRSGGPKMTIEDIGEYDYSDQPKAKCVWFEKTKRCEGIFDFLTIHKV